MRIENNFSEFNGQCYEQIICTAMGARSTLEISDICMKDITDEKTSKFQHADKIIYHGRFRDDGFILCSGSPDEIKDFFDIGNSCHIYLRFTYEYLIQMSISWTLLFTKGRGFQIASG
jgi:hypothetical protein